MVLDGDCRQIEVIYLKDEHDIGEFKQKISNKIIGIQFFGRQEKPGNTGDNFIDSLYGP